jgi:hypothetical protein
MMLSALLDAFRGSRTAAEPAEDHVAHVSTALLRTMLEGQFRDLRIELCEGEGRSSVAFPSALGLPRLTFRADVDRVSLRSRRTFATLRDPEPGYPNGAIELEIWLEPLNGMGKQATLSVMLALSTDAQGAVYDDVDVRCENEQGVDPLIETCVEAFFYWAYTREAIAGVLRAAIGQSVGGGAAILDVTVEGSKLAVWRCAPSFFSALA